MTGFLATTEEAPALGLAAAGILGVSPHMGACSFFQCTSKRNHFLKDLSLFFFSHMPPCPRSDNWMTEVTVLTTKEYYWGTFTFSC